MSILATSRPASTFPPGVRSCNRCGIEREARARSALCMDCIRVLTRAEAAVWQGAA